MNRLEITNLTKRYKDFLALKNVNLLAEEGQCIAIVGNNGAGKSTLIKCITGLSTAYAGRVNKNGMAMGYVPEIQSLPANVTVQEYLAVMMELCGGVGRASSIELQGKWGLKDQMHKRLGTLSKGNRQKVAIVQAFQIYPDIIILDEPFNGLDPYSQDMLRSELNSFVEKKGIVIISTHLLKEVETIATHVAVVTNNSILPSISMGKIAKTYGGLDSYFNYVQNQKYETD